MPDSVNYQGGGGREQEPPEYSFWRFDIYLSNFLPEKGLQPG